MKLKDKYNDPNNMVDYKLETGENEYCLSQMPATVAEEIVQRASSIGSTDEEGFELLVNGNILLPKGIFEFEGDEAGAAEEEATPRRKPRKGGEKAEG